MNGLFIVLGLIILVIGWFFQRGVRAKGAKAQQWPTTAGTVISSQIAAIPMGNNTMMTPAVVYSYSVGGQQLEGSGYRVGAPPLFNKPAKAQALADRFRAGQQVTVHYDPAQPTTAALDLQVGEGYGPLMVYSFGATFVGLGVLFSFIH
ncbi:MAG TPA: DUF3592 domain-containing protein [Caulobacteraceae bacterium]|jgi:hypothetical protein